MSLSFDFRLQDGRVPRAIVFDLDETLIAGDSTIGWVEWLYESGTTSDPLYRQATIEMAHRYRAGTLDIAWFLRTTAPAYSHLPKTLFDVLVGRFVREKVLPLAYPAGSVLVAAAKQAGIPVLVISASASFIVKPVAEGLGISPENVIGIDLVEVNGVPTGEIHGTPSFREGKIARLRQWGKTRGITPQDVYFFTDSRNDLPLAREAGNVGAVNPDETLRQEALIRGWTILHWTR